MRQPRNRWTIIANASAGRGRSVAWARDLSHRLNAQGAEAVVRGTDAPGAAPRLAQDAVEAGSTRIVASGGDGTVHEVVIGVKAAPASRRPELELGILLAGRCNDLAHALGLPEGPDAAIRGLLQHRTQTLDLGHVVGRGPVGQARAGTYFTTFATFGFDSEVAAFVDAGRVQSYLGASGAYLYGVAGTLRSYAWPDATVRGDFGTFRGQVLLAAGSGSRRTRERTTASWTSVCSGACPSGRSCGCCPVRSPARMRGIPRWPITGSGRCSWRLTGSCRSGPMASS